jgi:hypothetical protein
MSGFFGVVVDKNVDPTKIISTRSPAGNGG